MQLQQTGISAMRLMTRYFSNLVGLFLVVPPAAGGQRRPALPVPWVEQHEDPHVEGEGADDPDHHDHHHLINQWMIELIN